MGTSRRRRRRFISETGSSAQVCWPAAPADRRVRLLGPGRQGGLELVEATAGFPVARVEGPLRKELEASVPAEKRVVAFRARLEAIRTDWREGRIEVEVTRDAVRAAAWERLLSPRSPRRRCDAAATPRRRRDAATPPRRRCDAPPPGKQRSTAAVPRFSRRRSFGAASIVWENSATTSGAGRSSSSLRARRASTRAAWAARSFRRADIPQTSRGDAAAGTWMVRGHESRRRDVEISVETGARLRYFASRPRSSARSRSGCFATRRTTP